MMLVDNPPIHLTYCLNVHPGETWDENLAAIRNYTLPIRDRLGLKGPFGLGLRLGHQAAKTLRDKQRLQSFKSFLKEHDLYVFTINGFPYSDFHDVEVKQKVYAPDWREKARLDYTLSLAEILAGLLPENVSGSISTVPGSYKSWISSEDHKRDMIRNLMACVARFADIENKTGKHLHLGLEPEPDCFIETTGEVVAFMRGDLLPFGREYLAQWHGFNLSKAEKAIREHLGICFDTCHMSVQFEGIRQSIKMLRKEGIRLSKVQLSSALRVTDVKTKTERLKAFCDPVYLHQVKALSPKGDILGYSDLPEALSDDFMLEQGGREWRIHFHVPLYFRGDKDFGSTSDELTPAFFKEAVDARCDHFEIETYTFQVLPEAYRRKGIVESITDEYDYVFRRILGSPESSSS